MLPSVLQELAAGLSLLLASVAATQAPQRDAQPDSEPPGATQTLAPRPAMPRSVPLLWRIEPPTKGGKAGFLFGTMHTSEPGVIDLGMQVEHALNGADTVFTELLSTDVDPDALIGRMVLPGEQTLHDVLPEATLALLEQVVAGFDDPETVGMIYAMKPEIAEMLILEEEYPEDGDEELLDDMIEAGARYNGKRTLALETVDEQMAVTDCLTEAERVQSLHDTLVELLKDRATGRNRHHEMVDLYCRGDVERLWGYAKAQMHRGRPFDAKLAKAMGWDRNQRMADRAHAYIAEHPDQSVFIAVGAAHMPGHRGLVEQFRSKGYTVTRIPDALTRAERAVEWAAWDLEVARWRLAKLRAEGAAAPAGGPAGDPAGTGR